MFAVSPSRCARSGAFAFLLLVLCLALAPAGRAGSLFVLHAFPTLAGDGTNARGAVPAGPLVKGADGGFYGITEFGGANGYGTLFRVTARGAFTVLHTFAFAEGAYPTARLALGADGKLYGAAVRGGASGYGTVFAVAADGSGFTVLHTFTAAGDGANPVGLTRGANGVFYGATADGGLYGNGTLFQITAQGTLTTLHAFSALNNQGHNADGQFPQAPLLRACDGNLYGTASRGGGGGAGTVFRLTPGGQLTLLHSFAGKEGAYPRAALTEGKDGRLYGVTDGGGLNASGVVYAFNPAASGDTLQRLYSFEAPDGMIALAPAPLDTSPEVGPLDADNPVVLPETLALLPHGDFLGTASHGGTNGTGFIYRITPKGVFTLLRSFDPQVPDDGSPNTYGAAPNGPLVPGANGFYYGTATIGGANASGTVFRFGPVP